MALVIWLRYTALTMLPRIAMPSAPPSSWLVSEIAAAAPARWGGVGACQVLCVSSGDVLPSSVASLVA
ncbi:hypothetical protein, partial [Actinomadura alba]|uniref:hypothetical protein n=1 Tax=Actinomadura alba TaxID=406431 RepID=UPI0031D02953